MARKTEENSDNTDMTKLKTDFNKLLVLTQKLIERLHKTEPYLKKALGDNDPDDEVYLVPTGTWFGKEYK